ncbi:hypothetical protein SUDANB130_06738 [Streptomyces sp. enrichment culture]
MLRPPLQSAPRSRPASAQPAATHRPGTRTGFDEHPVSEVTEVHRVLKATPCGSVVSLSADVWRHKPQPLFRAVRMVIDPGQAAQVPGAEAALRQFPLLRSELSQQRVVIGQAQTTPVLQHGWQAQALDGAGGQHDQRVGVLARAVQAGQAQVRLGSVHNARMERGQQCGNAVRRLSVTAACTNTAGHTCPCAGLLQGPGGEQVIQSHQWLSPGWVSPLPYRAVVSVRSSDTLQWLRPSGAGRERTQAG